MSANENTTNCDQPTTESEQIFKNTKDIEKLTDELGDVLKIVNIKTGNLNSDAKIGKDLGGNLTLSNSLGETEILIGTTNIVFSNNLHMSNFKITNMGDGTRGASSTDAINASQIWGFDNTNLVGFSGISFTIGQGAPRLNSPDGTYIEVRDGTLDINGKSITEASNIGLGFGKFTLNDIIDFTDLGNGNSLSKYGKDSSGNLTLTNITGDIKIIWGTGVMNLLNYNIDMNNGSINELADPTTALQATNKQYVDLIKKIIRQEIEKILNETKK